MAKPRIGLHTNRIGDNLQVQHNREMENEMYIVYTATGEQEFNNPADARIYASAHPGASTEYHPSK